MNKSYNSKGFTLIELLIVIAVLGVLASVVLVAINPVEQLARARDAGRKTTVGQLSKAVQAYYTSRNAAYPAATAPAADGTGGWIKTLVDAGEVKTIPAAITYSISGTAACTTNAQNGWCYNTNTTPEAAVWVRLESGSEKSKCTTTTPVPFFMWDSSRGSTCLVCKAADTGPAIGDTCNTPQ